MNKKVAIIISPNWKDYAEKYLADCIISLRKQDYRGGMKFFITDNETSEESFLFLKKVLEEMDCGSEPAMTNAYEIIRNKNNDGFAKGNNDAMKLALEQGFDYIILFNMDTVIELNCVRKMVEATENKKILDSRLRGNDKINIGAVQARIMLWPEKDKINSLGNVTHFLGFGYCDCYNKKIANCKLQIENYICYPSGAAVLFTAEALKRVGLFDEEYWMYNEDQDLGWRIWLAGFKCVLAPDAVAYHKYEFSRSIKQFYYLDRNRLITILKNYHWLTLILIFPAFLVMELGLIFFSIFSGNFRNKLAVYKYFLSKKNWRYILAKRREAQALRQVKDRDIIKYFSGKIWYQEVGGAALKIANIIFTAYWKIVRVLIVW